MDAAADKQPGALDGRTLRRVCSRYATGVAVIGAAGAQGRAVGLTVNSFASCRWHRPDPLEPRAALAQRRTVRAGRGFRRQRPACRPGALARHFATPAPDKFSGVAHRRCPAGVPYLDDAPATLACRVVRADPIGDHLLVVGEVESCEAGRASRWSSTAAASCASLPRPEALCARRRRLHRCTAPRRSRLAAAVSIARPPAHCLSRPGRSSVQRAAGLPPVSHRRNGPARNPVYLLPFPIGSDIV